MSLVRGRVLDIQDDHVIILTADCQYLKVAKPPGQIRKGSEIEATLPRQRKVHNGVLAAVLSVAAALLLILNFQSLTNYIAPSPTAYGAIAIDINPAIELSFDKKLRVLDIRAINPEGEYLLENIHQGMDIFTALASAVDKAHLYGYLDAAKEDNALMLTLVGGTKTAHLLGNLETALADQLESMNLKVSVYAHQTGWSVRDKAINQGISVNRFILREILQNGDSRGQLLDLLLEAIPASSIRQIVAEPHKPGPSIPGQEPGKPNENNPANPGNSPIKNPPRDGKDEGNPKRP